MDRSRKIGLPLATVLVAGNMIGSGIFLLPASLAAIGSVSTIGWIIALAGALFIAATLAHLANIAPDAGGLCAYPRVALGRFAGYHSSALYWMCAWIGNIAIAIAAIGYLAKLFPSIGSPVSVALGVIALIWIVTAVNILGPRFACQMQSIAFATGLLPILLVAILGWRLFDSAQFSNAWNLTGHSDAQAVSDSLVLVFWAFTGLESASISSGVVNNPQRNVPLATVGGVIVAGVVYLAACSVIIGMIAPDQLSKSTSPFADATQLIIGAAAGQFVAALAFLKSTGSLSGMTLVTAQVGKTAAELALFPRIFSRSNASHVPVANLIIMAILMTGVVFATLSPTLNEQFNKLIELSVLLCLISYLYAIVSLWRYPRQRTKRSFVFLIMSVAAAATCIWLISTAGATLLLWTAGIAAITAASYPLFSSSQAQHQR